MPKYDRNELEIAARNQHFTRDTVFMKVYARNPAHVANAAPVVHSPVFSSTLSQAIPLSIFATCRCRSAASISRYQSGNKRRVLPDFLCAAFPVSVIPVVRSVDRSSRAQRMIAQGTVKLTERQESRHFTVFPHRNFAHFQGASLQQNAGAAVSHIASQRNATLIRLPHAKGSRQSSDTEAACPAAAEISDAVRTV